MPDGHDHKEEGASGRGFTHGRNIKLDKVKSKRRLASSQSFVARIETYISFRKYVPGMSRKKRNQKLYRQEQRKKARALKAEANAKEKFNIVEEFFVCLACIFD